MAKRTRGVPNVPPNNVGVSFDGPTYEWYIREGHLGDWFGPLTYRAASSQAIRSTLDGDELDIKVAQLGTPLGERPGDPVKVSPGMKVVRIYVNGKLTFSGKAAEFHKDKIPFR